MKVALFSGSINDPASRFRYRQHFNSLKAKGIKIYDYQAKDSQYPPIKQIKRPIWLLEEVFNRRREITEVNSKKFDLHIIQREMISTLCTLEHKVRHPKVFDIDDAVWTRQRFRGVDKIIMDVDSIICGNQVLADYVSQFNKNIFIIPTAIDTERFYPMKVKKDEEIVIGWSGTSSGYNSVYEIEESLFIILNKYQNTKLIILSDKPPVFKKIPYDRYKFIPWSINNEAKVIQSMDIGIMPVKNTMFNKGKCSYKMLLYMACGIPVVVSPVGMNNDVLSQGEVGFGVSSREDWVYSLETLINEETLRKRLGKSGRDLVMTTYSNEVISNKIHNTLQNICKY